MGKKIEEIASKIYKPEILTCPKCGSSLKYKYTVSNKVVQFTSGKYLRIKNLGYGCLNCDDGHTYFSQTANKLSFKGYTYSSKIICMIAYYKARHYGRDAICDMLASKGIEISDRNIDIIYKRFTEIYTQDYDTIIRKAYKDMLDNFGEIRLSIDSITIEDCNYIIMYDYFTSEKLAIWTFNGLNDPELPKMLIKYLSNNNITLIASVRDRKESKFLPILKKIVRSNTKFISFHKF